MKSLKLISNRINYEALIVGSGNLKDKITYKNLSGILSLINNVNTLDLNGVEKGPISKVDINNVTLEQYCNYLKISHFLPKNNFTLKNIVYNFPSFLICSLIFVAEIC